MLGTYRLILALLVALSHADVRWAGLNPGVIAVVGFYAISGYVMTGLIRAHYPSLSLLPGFYLDRALRLLPAYYAVALLALAWFFWDGPKPPFLAHAPGAADLLNNLLVVPLNYFMWNQSDHFVLVPPAWSLGCEIQFYLVFPLLLLRRVRLAALLASLAVYFLAVAGQLHTDWYGYRLLPGVLFIFLLGSWLYDAQHSAQRTGAWLNAPRLCAIVLAITLALAFAAWRGALIRVPFNGETLIGIGLCVPLLAWLAHCRRRGWDERAGDLSYGLFLVHFLVYWIWPGAEQDAGALTLRIAVSLLLAWGLHKGVEAPVLAWRHRLRSTDKLR